MSFAYREYSLKRNTDRLVFVTDVHLCHLKWHGTNAADRLDILCDALAKEYEIRPYDAILSLGDYSLDFWLWQEGGSCHWDPPVSRTTEFVERFVPKMPTRFFMIPGNHEQYGHERFEEITGMPREYALVWGDVVFIMLDTFGGNLDPVENHDGVYTGINVELVRAVLDAHPDKRIFLCAHDICIEKESESARELIACERRIVSAFTGHTHKNNVLILPEGWRHFPIFYCGDFSYNSGRDREKNWGFRTFSDVNGTVSTEYARI